MPGDIFAIRWPTGRICVKTTEYYYWAAPVSVPVARIVRAHAGSPCRPPHYPLKACAVETAGLPRTGRTVPCPPKWTRATPAALRGLTGDSVIRDLLSRRFHVVRHYAFRGETWSVLTGTRLSLGGWE